MPPGYAVAVKRIISY